MRSRLMALKRLMDIYGVIESIHLAELQRADAAVREVRHAISKQQEVTLSAGIECRQSLEAGDVIAWSLAEVTREIANLKRQRLEPMHEERETLRDAASGQYAASRLRSEQMERLVAKAAEEIEIEDSRKTQAASDDRFLARRRWEDARAESRSVDR